MTMWMECLYHYALEIFLWQSAMAVMVLLCSVDFPKLLYSWIISALPQSCSGKETYNTCRVDILESSPSLNSLLPVFTTKPMLRTHTATTQAFCCNMTSCKLQHFLFSVWIPIVFLSQYLQLYLIPTFMLSVMVVSWAWPLSLKRYKYVKRSRLCVEMTTASLNFFFIQLQNVSVRDNACIYYCPKLSCSASSFQRVIQRQPHCYVPGGRRR